MIKVEKKEKEKDKVEIGIFFYGSEEGIKQIKKNFKKNKKEVFVRDDYTQDEDGYTHSCFPRGKLETEIEDILKLINKISKQE